MLMGTYEQACVPWSPHDGAVDVRHGAAAARPRPHRPVAGDRLQALPGDGDGRHQADHQRTVHVRPRRQPAGRADPRHPQLLGGVRGDGRAVAGRRRRPGAGQLDDDGRPAARHLGRWTSPASATGPTSPTPTPRCARTTAGGSASRSPTRSCRRPARCTRRRSTTGSPSTTPCGAPGSASSTRCGSSGPAWSRSRRSRSGAPTPSRSSPRSARRCASGSA